MTSLDSMESKIADSRLNLTAINCNSDSPNEQCNSTPVVHIVNFSKSPDISEKDTIQDENCDILSQYMGHFGWWQFKWSSFLFLFQIPTTYHMFAIVFQSAQKDFWCKRPYNLQNLDINVWRNLTQPIDACSILNYDYASMKDVEQFYNITSQNKPTELIKCNAFEYATDTMGGTIISDWDLVCENTEFLSIVEMCFLAGAALGSILSGWISDKYGRKHILMIVVVIQCVFGMLLTFSNALAMFMSLRVIIGFASMTVTVVSFVLVVELVSGKWRTIIGILNLLPVPLSYIITAAIAYYTREWRLMQFATSIPWFVLLLMWKWLPESPRWLLEHGRIDELKNSIEDAAKINGIDLPANYEKTLEAYIKENNNKENVREPILVLFSKEYRLLTFLVIVVWFSMILVYFGLTLHLNNLGGDIYLNSAIAGALEAVSICISIPIVLKMGIRVSLISFMFLAGVACLLVNIIPSGNLWAVITLAMIGKCTMGANNAVISTYTAQQYATVVRNFGIGIGNFASGMALITIPYMWLLEHVQVYLPMTVMGCAGIVGAIGLIIMKNNPRP